MVQHDEPVDAVAASDVLTERLVPTVLSLDAIRSDLGIRRDRELGYRTFRWITALGKISEAWRYTNRETSPPSSQF
jgi:hypothetical protein